MEKDVYGYVLNKLTPNPCSMSEEEEEKLIEFLKKLQLITESSSEIL